MRHELGGKSPPVLVPSAPVVRNQPSVAAPLVSV